MVEMDDLAGASRCGGTDLGHLGIERAPCERPLVLDREASARMLAALGGLWWPLEIVPAFMQELGRALPTGQIITVFHDMIGRGHGLAELHRVDPEDIAAELARRPHVDSLEPTDQLRLLEWLSVTHQRFQRLARADQRQLQWLLARFERLGELFDVMRAEARKEGRDPSEIEITTGAPLRSLDDAQAMKTHAEGCRSAAVMTRWEGVFIRNQKRGRALFFLVQDRVV